MATTYSGTTATSSYWEFLPAQNEYPTYDLRGNRLTDSLYAYTWDELNRLTSVVRSGLTIPDEAKVRVNFTYDAQGRRASKTVSTCSGTTWTAGPTRKFIYSGWLLVAETDASGNLLRSYTWGQDMGGGGGVGGLLAVTTYGSGAAVYWPVYDTNGNVVSLVKADSTPTVAASYEYSPFGELLTVHAPSGGAVTMADPTAICPLLFSTKYFDAEIGLYTTATVTTTRDR